MRSRWPNMASTAAGGGLRWLGNVGIQKGWADLDFSSIAQHYGYPHQDNLLPEYGLRRKS